MDTNLEQAVGIALQGSADPALKQQAIQFCNEVKDSPDGWQLCLTLFTGGTTRSEESRFFALQVIDSRLPTLNSEQVQFVKTSLFPFVQNAVSTSGTTNSILGPPYMRNKLAQTLAYLFILCYLDSWTTFFNDLFQLMATGSSGSESGSSESPVANPQAVDMYLRILRIIHEEIGENIYQRSGEQTTRNNLLKDRIRQQELRKLTDSWMMIIDTYTQDNITAAAELKTEILDGVLKVIGGWVSWIDITLIVTPTYLNLIFSQLMNPQLRLTSCDTISEIVLKKMKPGEKLELISLLNLTNVIAQLPMQSTDDIDFIERVAKLANCVGTELLHVFDGTTSAKSGVNPTPEEAEKAEQILITMFPTVFEFLSHEYDDVTKQVLPLIAEYLQFIRRESKKAKSQVNTDNLPKNALGRITDGFPRDSEFVAPQRAAFIRTILERVLLKMKYDSEADWEEDDDDEDEFMKLRGRLRIYLDHIASIDVDMFIDGMASVINESLVNSNGKTWQDIELGMYCLFVIGDCINNAYTGSNILLEPRTDNAVNELFLKMVQSDVVSTVNHPSIQKWYMELVVKHAALLLKHTPALVHKVLEMFVSPIGVHNSVESVRVRSWYLFFRFVKTIKPLAGDIAETVFNSITDVLVIKVQPPSVPKDGEALDVESEQDSVATSQRYLYELCGMLFSMASNQEQGLTLTQNLLRPLYADIEQCVSNPNLSDPLNVLRAHHTLYALGTFVRGFNDYLPKKLDDPRPPMPKAAEEIKNIAQVASVVMERMADAGLVRDACRFVYQFLITLFGMDILGPVTQFISVMLSKCNDVEMADFLIFLAQIFHNYKSEQAAFEMFASLITPLENRVIASLNKSTDGSTDFQLNQKNLKRAYLQFIQSIFTNGMGSIFLFDNNKQALETVLESALHFSTDTSDISSAKLALVLLNKLLLVWATGVVKADPSEADCFGKGIEVKHVFNKGFIFERYTKLCWQDAANTGIGKKDATARVIVSEMALLQKTLYEQTGTEYCNYLAETYFPSVGFSQDMMTAYFEQLTTSKIKDFRKYFVQLIEYLTTQ